MISRKQYRKLKRIELFNGTTGRDYNKNKLLYDYLTGENYLITATVRGYKGFVVSERGRAEMYTFKVEHFRFWFPSIVSILALIASILTLASSNPDFWINAGRLFRDAFSSLRG